MKQKNNFHTLCLLLSERFKFTNKQSEKKAHEIIQRGINQFEIENQNIRLNLKEQRYFIEELYSLVISKLNGDVDSIEDLQIYTYTRDFEEMTASVIGSINQKEELETIPPVKAKSKISEAQKCAYLKYIHSVKGQEALKRYRQSAKGKSAQKRAILKYIHSAKGQEVLKRYRQSEKGKLTIGKAVKKYQQTAKGKSAVKRAMKKYCETDRGREKRREAVRAYRQRQKEKSIMATGEN